MKPPVVSVQVCSKVLQSSKRCLLKHLRPRFSAEAINRWLYFELVPCDVSKEESET